MKSYTKGPIVPDRKDPQGLWIISFNTITENSYVQQYTDAGRIWQQMNNRCSKNSKYFLQKITYKDCINAFKDFQEFVDWCHVQEGYCLQDESGTRWALDKDILIFGNKTYSPETCCFVPPYINGLFVGCKKKTNLPLGVNFRARFNKYVSQINLEGKRKHLGHFENAYDAHVAWMKGKITSIENALTNYRHSKGYREDVAQALINRIEMLKSAIVSGLEITAL